ncbi:MAG: DPP IV N-terminal domain-containing protein [Gemmatimonadales bacterium]
MTAIRRTLLLLTAVGLPAATGYAQPASPARRDSVYQRFLDLPSLAKGGIIQPRWMADSTRFWYLDSTPDRTVIQLVDPVAGTRAPLVDVDRARAAIGRALGHQPPYLGLPGSGFVLADQERGLRFSLEGRDWVLDLASYAVRPVPVPSPAERDRREPRLVERAWPTTGTDLRELASPDGRWLASHRDGNLWLRSTADGRDQQLTFDAVTDFGWTVAGAKWSPDGLRLAALKIDNRGLAKLPVLHWLKPTEEVEWRPFTKVGGAMARFEVHVVDILSARTVVARFTDTVDSFLSPIGWTPDNAELLFYRMTRDMKRLELAAIRPATGQTRVVLTETQPTFIKNIAANPGWRDLVTLLPDGKRFVLISERDGWDHLYLYGLDGTLVRRLTSGSFPVLRVVAVDIKGGWVYFTGHAEPRPYHTHLYRVALDGSGFKRLTEGTGIHAAAFSPSMRHFVDHHSSIDRPPTAELRTADGRLVMTLATANTDSLRALGWRPPEEFVAKAADGTTDLHGVLIKPFDFDSTRKYPIVEYIYGGPQTTTVVRTFGQSWVKEQAIAQLGFVAVVVDARGTPERGKAFQDVVYRNFGRNEILDHAAVLKQLGTRHRWLDLTRVGIYGGSWGGYMTIRALVLAPDTYHVGIATFPVGDLYDHAASAIEPYMGLVETNRAGYDYGSSLRNIDRLRGKLMLLHGTSDVNATFSATMKMVDALTKAGKPYDLRVFPELNHSLTGIETYFAETVRRYFVEHLKP